MYPIGSIYLSINNVNPSTLFGGTWEDQLTKFNSEIITYDNIGNPITIGNRNLTWINGRQLQKYVQGNQIITY